MFDIGFPELLIISVVALLVFGPERLPEVLRTVGGWLGSARRSFTTLKAELEKEVGADEIRRDLHNSRIMEEAKQLQRQMSSSKDEVEELLGKRYAARPEQEHPQRSGSEATGDDAEPAAPAAVAAPDRSDDDQAAGAGDGRDPKRDSGAFEAPDETSKHAGSAASASPAAGGSAQDADAPAGPTPRSGEDQRP